MRSYGYGSAWVSPCSPIKVGWLEGADRSVLCSYIFWSCYKQTCKMLYVLLNRKLLLIVFLVSAAVCNTWDPLWITEECCKRGNRSGWSEFPEVARKVWDRAGNKTPITQHPVPCSNYCTRISSYCVSNRNCRAKLSGQIVIAAAELYQL